MDHDYTREKEPGRELKVLLGFSLFAVIHVRVSHPGLGWAFTGADDQELRAYTSFLIFLTL